METGLPPEFTGALKTRTPETRGRRVRARVVQSEREHRLIELTAHGFVIEADGRPPLRGFVEIFIGEERIDHRLVVCNWAKDGHVGYEFKRDSAGGDVAPDYVPSDLAGLLPPA
ncbi:MAG: hypothetical protein AAF526_04540 [Pseudomonadota bacterium]